jgi:hypothetical protein
MYATPCIFGLENKGGEFKQQEGMSRHFVYNLGGGHRALIRDINV